MTKKRAEIGILLEKTAARRRQQLGVNEFGVYLGEILAHAGIGFRWLASADELETCECDLVLVALADDCKATAAALQRFAEQGGGVIAYGGQGSAMPAAFGCRADREQGAGYARMTGPDGKSQTLRYLRAVPWQGNGTKGLPPEERGALHHESPQGRTISAALQQFAVGAGFFDRWAVDIPATIVMLQQGSQPIFTDGAPAPDRTAALDDGFLKADDGYEVDWMWDRLRTDTGQSYFAYPYADLWREVLIGHLLRRTLERGQTVPLIGYWPEGVRHVAAISHDSDGNLDAEAEATLELLSECGISSTWCMLEPGYSANLYNQIRENGHELAFHYNAVEPDQGIWSEAELQRQLDWLRGAIGAAGPVTNKNHLTRMEGWGEFFRWCERAGISCDSSRGPSKKGNVGFLFGTCHPYFPIAWADEENRLYDVLEIGFLTQDLDQGKWADRSVIVPFLEAVLQVGGVAHFLVHQYHIYRRQEVRDALRMIVAEATKRGFSFRTIRQIEQWERYRRQLRVADVTECEGEWKAAVVDKDSSPNGNGGGGHPVVWIPLAESGCHDPDEKGLERHFGVLCRRAAIARI